MGLLKEVIEEMRFEKDKLAGLMHQNKTLQLFIRSKSLDDEYVEFSKEVTEIIKRKMKEDTNETENT